MKDKSDEKAKVASIKETAKTVFENTRLAVQYKRQKISVLIARLDTLLVNTPEDAAYDAIAAVTELRGYMRELHVNTPVA